MTARAHARSPPARSSCWRGSNTASSPGSSARDRRWSRRELAAQFGVSKTPVREALKTLAGTGLVVMSQYKGVTVRMVDADMAREVYDVRLLLEPEALRRTVRRGLPGRGAGGAGARRRRHGHRRTLPRQPGVPPRPVRALRQSAARPGCSTRCATRPPWCPPSPGPPIRPGSGRPASTGRSCGSPWPATRTARPRALHGHIAVVRARRAFPDGGPRHGAPMDRNAVDDVRSPADRTRRCGGDPRDPVRRGRRRSTAPPTGPCCAGCSTAVSAPLTPNGNTGEFYALDPRGAAARHRADHRGGRGAGRHPCVGVGHDVPTAVAAARHAREPGRRW